MGVRSVRRAANTRNEGLFFIQECEPQSKYWKQLCVFHMREQSAGRYTRKIDGSHLRLKAIAAGMARCTEPASHMATPANCIWTIRVAPPFPHLASPPGCTHCLSCGSTEDSITPILGSFLTYGPRRSGLRLPAWPFFPYMPLSRCLAWSALV